MTTTTTVPTLSNSATKVLKAIQKSPGHDAYWYASELHMKPSDVKRRCYTLLKATLIAINNTGLFFPVTNLANWNPPTTTFVTTTPPKKVLKNHFILVRDCSGSMQHIASKAQKLFQKQLEVARTAKDQDNIVTVYDFGVSAGYVVERCFMSKPKSVSSLPYTAEGQTPLYDGVMLACWRAKNDDKDEERSFVVMVLTDGEENFSTHYTAAQLKGFIKDQQATDRWTFVFLVPKGYKDNFVRLSGVYPDNVQEWDDIAQAEQAITVGTSNYVQLRAAGLRSVRNWFSTDLSKVDSADLHQLTDITHQVKIWNVEKESVIEPFVKSKLGTFTPGASYYEVMKKEKEVQDYKRLLLMDKKTKRIYADGPKVTVRELSGLPKSGGAAIDPGNHADYVLFVQSMSTNRILPRGTRLAYWG